MASQRIPSQLGLLGHPRLSVNGAAVRLDRRTAAVLAYLALEGETPKYRLAGWLWPDSLDVTARNNMRQLLRRIRASAGEDVIEGEDRIRLGDHVQADAAELQAASFSGDHAHALEFEGELLDGLEFDDCPDVDEWLINARESLAALRRSAASAEAARLEQSGDLSGALEYANAHVRLEPLSEEAHRRVMRLHYLLGDRAAALEAFERCKSLLERELGVEPLPETLALAREIERGGRAPSVQAPARASLPVAVLRPPVLAGREREWAQLEAAWEAGQFIAISGEPGAGKTRLMLDFVASKVPREAILHLQSRPGDALVPYSSHARNWRQMIEQFRPDLEPWVRFELSRIVPELSDGEPPGPIRSEADKLRFYQAKLESMVACTRAGLRVLASDDVQYTDPASAEASLYLMGAFAATGQRLGAVYAFRPDEISSNVGGVLEQAANAGLMAHVKLEPLGAASVSKLLDGLNLLGTEELAPALTRYAGGNPLFVLETVRHLFESGQLERGWPGRLPPPGKVGPLVARRLERLSEPARRLAWAAAVLGSELSLERAARTLEVGALDLAGAWAELENAQVLRGSAFSHDLIFEATLTAIPAVVRGLLHKRAATVLEAEDANPARVAGHWLEGGEPARAAPWLVRAAESARRAYRFGEAITLAGQATSLFEADGRTSEAFEAFFMQAELLLTSDFGERLEATVERLLALAATPAQRARAWKVRAELLRHRNDHAGNEQAARTGYRFAIASNDPQLAAQLLMEIAGALWIQDRVDEAAGAFEEAWQLARDHGDIQLQRAALVNLAGIRSAQGRFEDAIHRQTEALALAEELGDLVGRVRSLNDLSYVLVQVGRAADALERMREAHGLFSRIEGEDYQRIRSFNLLAWAHRDLGALGDALKAVQDGLSVAQKGRLPRCFLQRTAASIWLGLGLVDEAQRALDDARDDPYINEDDRLGIAGAQARVMAQRGDDPSAALEETARRVQASGRVRPLVQLRTLEAKLRPPEQALEAATHGLELIQRHGLHGYEAATLSGRARAFLELGQAQATLEAAEAALAALRGFSAVELSPIEPMLLRVRSLEALRNPRVGQALEETLVALLEMARTRIPAEFRDAFLQQHPTHRAVLEMGKTKGLEYAIK